ncbi:hypothetical protein SESBI_28240 [Sesbania bispinosa]|nr:hypothetical protein SESBI_28240 [Sesbania bispinosa]
METPVRFSSCRGVAFEVKPHADPFAIETTPTQQDPSNSKRFWPLATSRVFSSSIQRSSSKPSSHFCDLDLDEDDIHEEETYYVEKQNDHDQDQPSKPAPSRKNESRLSILGRSWVPLFLKTATTSLLQSLGGIHSGCGVSSIAWLVYALVLTLKDRDNTSPEIIGVSSAILALLCLSSMAAFPLVRHLHHNVFERSHRFAGWMALCLLWAFIMLTISYDPKTKSYSNEFGSRLIKSQEFWLTVTITILIIMPWLTVRRVPVKVSTASGHASIIKFEGGIKAGILGRISPSPLSEWHAFGIISDGKKEHMMLAGAVGDFTKSLVLNPPTHLWVRQVHFAGLPYLVNMYGRVLLVATGSGICVFLSFLLQPCKADVCLLWVAKGVEQNFGKEIKEMVSRHPRDQVIIHDTGVLGRPKVSEMSVSAAKNWGAEVVIVTSNPEGSRDVVDACKAAGIAAFGPIWDS